MVKQCTFVKPGWIKETYIWIVIYNVLTWTTEYESVLLEFTPISNRVEQMLEDIINCNVIRINDHDDVIKWKHFPRNWPFVWGIHRSPVTSLHKGQWRGALVFSLICVWINDCGNNREAGDLRRYRAHYYVIAMCCCRIRIILGYSGHCYACRYAGSLL